MEQPPPFTAAEMSAILMMILVDPDSKWAVDDFKSPFWTGINNEGRGETIYRHELEDKLRAHYKHLRGNTIP